MKISILVFVALCSGTTPAGSHPLGKAGLGVATVRHGRLLLEFTSTRTSHPMEIADTPRVAILIPSAEPQKANPSPSEQDTGSVAGSGAKNEPPSIPPQSGIPAIAKAANGIVVSITMLGNDGHQVAQGSGFFVSKDGRVLTNYHVVRNGSSAILKLRDGALFVVDGLLAFDEARDVAVIKTHGETLRAATLGNSDRLQVGDPVVAIGNPLDSTVSSGIVSGIRTERGTDKFLEVTAPISFDSSGGPLFNMKGEVIGITTSNVGAEGNLNFAVPINDVKPLLQADPSKLVNFPMDSRDPSKQQNEAAGSWTASAPPATTSSEALGMTHLTSEPAGAEIYVDDAFVGKAPAQLKLSPGKHVIRMFMNDYQNWVQWITVESGSPTEIAATLQKSN